MGESGVGIRGWRLLMTGPQNSVLCARFRYFLIVFDVRVHCMTSMLVTMEGGGVEGGGVVVEGGVASQGGDMFNHICMT
jgi:hypothetical protein